MKHDNIALAGCFVVSASASLLVPATTHATEEVRVIEERPPGLYAVDVEPHVSFGPENVYGASGFGGGIRVSIPLVASYLGRVPHNFALSVGADVIHYDNCYYGSYCSANYLMAPVAAQWNLFPARRLSVFGEAGAFFYRGWFNECLSTDAGCSAPPDTGILPTVAIGGRIHLGDFSALTLRLGYPTTTLGISFM